MLACHMNAKVLALFTRRKSLYHRVISAKFDFVMIDAEGRRLRQMNSRSPLVSLAYSPLTRGMQAVVCVEKC